jgi:hypothetical protein
MKRQRGRNRNNNNRNNQNRALDSNGPDVKVRGTASTIYEKYTTLARDAASSGNRVKAESYRQHAEHYLRVMNVQEAAKQEAREKAEAERAARGETESDDDDGNDNRRNNRNRNQNNRRRNQNNADGEGTPENSDAAPEGLEEVTPVVEKPKSRRKVVKPKNEGGSETAEAETEETPKRRRKAPARKSASDAVEPAE